MTFSGWLPSEFCTQTLKAALIVFWCFHQPITVLTWWQPKHTFVISFFSSGFFHSIRHVHKYPEDIRMLLPEANLLGIVSCKNLFLKDYSLQFVPNIFLSSVNDTEINARKKQCIMNKWVYYAECPHSAKHWVVILSLLIKTTRFFMIYLLYPLSPSSRGSLVPLHLLP